MLLLTRLQLVVIGINLSTSANVRPRRLFFIDRVLVLSRVVKQPGLTPNPRIISLPVDSLLSTSVHLVLRARCIGLINL